MASLYRKYRPQNFAQVVGQKFLVLTLKNQANLGQLAHAYLFCGSRGIGKTSLARIVAKAAVCKNLKEGEPCLVCDYCKQIQDGNYMDLLEIDAASNTGVDNIRELIEHVRFSPALGKYKIFIIDEVHMLSKGAFNALLKTLEEPPAHAIFILATTESHKVPATIISRTQRFDFKRITLLDLKNHLRDIVKQENRDIPPEVLDLIAVSSDGSMRDGLTLLEKALTLGVGAETDDYYQLLGITDRSLCLELMALLKSADLSLLPALFEKFLDRGVSFLIFTKDFLEVLRQLLVRKLSDSGIVQNKKIHPDDDLDQFTEMSLMDLVFITRLFLRAYKEMSETSILELPLLAAAAEACQRKKTGHNYPQEKVLKSNTEQLATDQNTLKYIPQADQLISETANQQIGKSADQQIQKQHENLPSIATSPSTLVAIKDVDTYNTLKDELSPTPVLQTYPDLNYEEVEKIWDSLISRLKEKNFPLANLISMATLAGVEGDKVILEVRYVFHKQNLQNIKYQELISGLLTEMLGRPAGFWVKVAPKSETGVEKSAVASVADALQILGGELVE